MTRISALPLLAALAAVALADGPAPASSDADALRDRRSALVARSPALSKAEVAAERFALGVWAREHGMPSQASEEFRAAVAADPSHEAAHSALGDVKLGERWVPQAEAMAAKGLVLRDGAWILREEAAILDLPEAEKALRRTGRAKVDGLLRAYAKGGEAQRKFAAEALAGVDDAFKLEPFAYALRSKSEEVRLLAAQGLGKLKDRRALKPLVRRALADPSESVRVAAIESAMAIGDANLIAPFAKALDSDDAAMRARAADAIGRIGDTRGVRLLIWRLEAHGGTGQRVFSSFTNQLTYIQDFDVEVAQTAFIADPQVGVLQEGIVNDVQIHSLDRVMTWVEREAIHGGLWRLTGGPGPSETDTKRDDAGWLKWWKEHEKEYTASK